MSKEVSVSLQEVLESSEMKTVLDRSKSVDNLFAEMIVENSPDLMARKPSPAMLDNGIVNFTDLDLSTFMFALADRGANIILPTYEASGPARSNSNQKVISNKNRNGEILGLKSHKDFFNFSVMINDQNVINNGEIGAPRCFSLVKYGKFYDGWKTVIFNPTGKEQKFIQDFMIAIGNRIVFKNFVHPNRRFSIFSKNYFILKALVERLKDEQKFLKDEEATMLKHGIKYPTKGKGALKNWGTTKQVGDSVSMKFKAFNCEIDMPEFKGDYANYKHNQQNLVEVSDKIREISRRIADLQYHVRTIEYAFYLHNLEEGNSDPKFPSWISGAKFENYTPKGKKAEWNRLIYGQKKVGELGYGIRYRIYELSDRVSADSSLDQQAVGY